jgi:hypothetical protein
MKLLTAIAFELYMSKCFGLLHVNWNSKGNISKTRLSEFSIFLAILGSSLLFSLLFYILLSIVVFDNVRLTQIVQSESKIGLVLTTFTLFWVVIAYGVLIVFTAAHQREQYLYYNILLNTEKQFNKLRSTKIENLNLFIGMKILTLFVMIPYLFTFYGMLQATSVDIRLVLLVCLDILPQLGLHAMKLNLIAQLALLNQRYSTLINIKNSEFAEHHKLFQAYQLCVKYLRKMCGYPFLFIFLYDFMKSLRIIYFFVMNSLLVSEEYGWNYYYILTSWFAWSATFQILLICHFAESFVRKVR